MSTASFLPLRSKRTKTDVAIAAFKIRCSSPCVESQEFPRVGRVDSKRNLASVGMHDWAEIYIAPWGWLPADASYGVSEIRRPESGQTFYCGHQDSYRLIVNLDWGRDLIPTKSSLRSEPADFQRGEVEVDGQNLYFDEWEAKSDVVRL